VGLIATLVAPLERAPANAANYPVLAAVPANALWNIERTEHIEVIERALREKVVGPDFRYVGQDGRLALARLCALTGRYDEAREWFAKSRAVLEEDGCRPLRAIVDHDEALMYVRRNADGDAERARPLLAAALARFHEIGMTGWVRRAEKLRASLMPN
jgi:tetratricopeptide (TPR) repeat protein